MYEEYIVVIEYGPAAGCLRFGGVPSPSNDLSTCVLLLLVVKWVEAFEVNQCIEYLSALVERPARSFYHLRIRVSTEKEEMAIILPQRSWIGRGPVAVNVQVLVVEPCGRVVPFGDLDWTCLVADVDQIEPISAAICIIIIRDGV